MTKKIDSRIPEGPIAEKWTNYNAHQRLVNPKNKLKLDVIVVGTGLAGASAAASLAEMGFNVYNFCIQLVLGIDETLVSLIVGPLLCNWAFRNS